jgi:hypothetical protein
MRIADHAQVIGSSGKDDRITAHIFQDPQQAGYYAPGGVAAHALIDKPELVFRQLTEQLLSQPELV